jgi:hypothetical protein
MASHGRDMNDLVSAIMVLDYRRIEQRGDDLADDVTLARPLSNDASELTATRTRWPSSMDASPKGASAVTPTIDPGTRAFRPVG